MTILRKDLIKIQITGNGYYNGDSDEDVISVNEIIMHKENSDFEKDLKIFNEFIEYYKQAALDMFDLQKELHNSDHLIKVQTDQLKSMLELSGMEDLLPFFINKYNLPSLTSDISDFYYSEALYQFLIKIGWEDLTSSIKSVNKLESSRYDLLY